jgi:pimeloyl-ACP methyl ester carboxylesterase
VALDQRGHGLSGQPPFAPLVPEGYSMEELLDDVTFLISALEMGKPVIVGHSWGATVALEFVGTHVGAVSGLVFVDGPIQSASNLFSWDEAQVVMQPPLPRFATFSDAMAQSQRDFEGAWADDLEAFVKDRVVPDGDALVLTLTARGRLELLRGLYDSQPDVLWPRVDVPAAALVARHSAARISRSTEQGIAQMAILAPDVAIRRFDSPHDIPLFKPAEVAAEIERIASAAGGANRSEAAAG